MHDFTAFILVLFILSAGTLAWRKPVKKKPWEKREVIRMEDFKIRNECDDDDERDTTMHQMLELRLPPVDPEFKDIFNWSEVIEIDRNLLDTEPTKAPDNISDISFDYINVECPPPVGLEWRDLSKRSDPFNMLPDLRDSDETTIPSYLRLKYPPAEPEVKDLPDLTTQVPFKGTEVNEMTEYNEVHELLFPPAIPEMKDISKREEVIGVVPAEDHEILKLRLPPAEPESGTIEVEETTELHEVPEVRLPPAIPQTREVKQRMYDNITEVFEESGTTIFDFSGLRFSPRHPGMKAKNETIKEEESTAVHELPQTRDVTPKTIERTPEVSEESETTIYDFSDLRFSPRHPGMKAKNETIKEEESTAVHELPQTRDVKPKTFESTPEVSEESETTIYDFSDLRFSPRHPGMKSKNETIKEEESTAVHELPILQYPPPEQAAEERELKKLQEGEYEVVYHSTTMKSTTEKREILELRLPSPLPVFKYLTKRSEVIDVMPQPGVTNQGGLTHEMLELRLPSLVPELRSTTKKPQRMGPLLPIVKDVWKRSENIKMMPALLPVETTENAIMSEFHMEEHEPVRVKYFPKVLRPMNDIEPMKVKAVSVPEGNVSKRAGVVEGHPEVKLSKNTLEIVVKLVQANPESDDISERSEVIEGNEIQLSPEANNMPNVQDNPELKLSNNALEVVVKLISVDPEEQNVSTTTEANECETPVTPDAKILFKRSKLIDWDAPQENPEVNISRAAVDILAKLKSALPEELRAKPERKDGSKIFKRAEEIPEIPLELQTSETPQTPIVIEVNLIIEQPEMKEVSKTTDMCEVKETTYGMLDQPEAENITTLSGNISQEIDPVNVLAVLAEPEVNISKRAETTEVKVITLKPHEMETPVNPVVVKPSDKPEMEEISKFVEVYELRGEITESTISDEEIEETDQPEEEDPSKMVEVIDIKEISETPRAIDLREISKMPDTRNTARIPEVKLLKNSTEINGWLESDVPESETSKMTEATSVKPEAKNYLQKRLSKLAFKIRCCRRGLRCCNKVSKKNEGTEFEVQAALEKCQKMEKMPSEINPADRRKRQDLWKTDKISCKNKKKLTEKYEVYNCKRKVKMQIMISNTGITNCKNQFFAVDHLEDPVTGKRQKVFNPFVIRIKQQPILQIFELFYSAKVNSKPREKIYTKKDTSYIGCDTNPFSSHPTCGLKKQDNDPIPFSTGFCCSCDRDVERNSPSIMMNPNSGSNLTFIVNITNSDDVVIVDNTLNENAVDKLGHVLQKRGGQDCNDSFTPPHADHDAYHQSTHCLEFSDIWYSVYDVKPPRIHHFFELDVLQKMPRAENESDFDLISQGDPIYVSEEFNQYTNEDNTIAINYVPQAVTLDTFALNPNIHKLLVPDISELEGTEKFPELRGGPEEYLVLNTNEIEPSGNRCDTAGVGYEAFANQPNRCSVESGTCLNNQPFDMWHHDHDAENSGELGKYFLKYFGQLPEESVYLNDNDPFNETVKFYYTECFISYLNMELNADDLIVLRPSYMAALTDAYIEATNPSVVSITVRVVNTGLTSGVFHIVVTDCPKDLPDSFSDLHTKKVLIDPQQVHNFYMEIECYFPKSHFTCTAQVQNENQDVLAVRQIKFQKFDRCFCSWHCQCVCLDADNGLTCVPLSLRDYNAAGYQGSEPLPRQLIEYTFLDETINLMMYVFLFLCIILFCMGLIKACLGCCTPTIGLWGLDVLLELPKRINRYYESELKGIRVQYNCQGWPIHPLTKRKARNIGLAAEFSINSVFFMLYPFAVIWSLIKRLCCSRYRHYQRVPTTPCKCKKGKGVKRKKKGLQKSGMKMKPKSGKVNKNRKKNKKEPKDPKDKQERKNKKDPTGKKNPKDKKERKNKRDPTGKKDPKNKRDPKDKKDPKHKKDPKDKKDPKRKKTPKDKNTKKDFEMKTTNEIGTNTKRTNTKRQQTQDKKYINKAKGTNTKNQTDRPDTKNTNKSKGTITATCSKFTQTTTV